MAALTEQEILNITYFLYETDDAGWDTTSAEYLSGRAFANAAIKRWENYQNTVWNELWTTLTASTQTVPTLVKTLTASTYTYTCPTDFRRPSSWVRTLDANNVETVWEVVKPQQIATLGESHDNFCYFTGNTKSGYTLNFNPEVTLTTGHTINYEYYKNATQFAAITDTTEVPDPYYIVYYVLARFLKNDGEDYGEERSQWQDLLENMRTENITGYFGISDAIPTVNKFGFGL
jgi:hypothetical protein